MIKTPFLPRSILLAATAVSLLFSGGVAKAEVQASSLELSSEVWLPLDGGRWAGVSFITGNQDYTLNSVTTFLNGVNVEDVDLRPVLYAADINGLPTGSAISAGFSSPILAVGEQNLTFTATSGITLVANTTYVFALTPLSDGVLWGMGGAANPYTGPWVILPVMSISTDNGQSWSDPFGSYRPMASIDATAVPEPSTWVLMGGSALLFAARLRRRN